MLKKVWQVNPQTPLLRPYRMKDQLGSRKRRKRSRGGGRRARRSKEGVIEEDRGREKKSCWDYRLARRQTSTKSDTHG